MRPIRLFLLMDIDNLRILMHILVMKLRNAIKQFMEIEHINISLIIEYHIPTNDLGRLIDTITPETIMKVADYIVNKYVKVEYNNPVNDIHLIHNYINVVKVCTGYNLNWQEQYNNIQNILNIKLNEERRSYPDNVFIDSTIPTDKRIVIYKSNNTYYSHLKSHLNRASITLNKDNQLCEAIKYVFNIDGYISPTLPSLHHRNGIFNKEICIFNSRGIIDLVADQCINFNLITTINTAFPIGNRLYDFLIKEYDRKTHSTQDIGDIVGIRESDVNTRIDDLIIRKVSPALSVMQKYFKRKYNKYKLTSGINIL